MTKARAGFVWRLGIVAATVALLGYVLWRIPIDEAAARLSTAQGWTWAGVIALSLLQVLIASLRFVCVANLFGLSVPTARLIRASVAGLTASLLMVNVIGSVLGRYALLKDAIGPPTVLAAIGLTERLAQAALAGSLFVLGAVYLYGLDASFEVLRGLRVLELLGALAIALYLFYLLDGSRRLRSRLGPLLQGLDPRWTIRALGLFLLQQGVILALYFAAARALGVQVGASELLAAAAVVTFLASLPISVNGWGVRELSSVLVLGAIGVDEASALAVSLFVGIASTVGVVLASALLAARWGRDAGPARNEEALSAPAAATSAPASQRLERLVAVVSVTGALAAGVLVFFQLHLGFGEGKISLNMADPLALFAAAALLAALIRPKPLIDAIPRLFLLWVLGLSAMIVVGFLIGVARFGVTDWALVNRLFGWGVLIGYITLGGAAVHAGGSNALRLLVTGLLSAGAAVTVFLVAQREVILLIDPSGQVSPVLEGLVQNRNAFAYQLIVALVAGIALNPQQRAGRGPDMWALSMATAGCGVWLTQSKTAFVTVVTIVLAIWLLSPDRRPLLRRTALYTLGVGLFFAGLALFINLWGQSVHDAPSLPSRTGELDIVRFVEYGLAERWTSILNGARLWFEHSMFGAGLGAFVAQHQQETGTFLVIHSIPIWILAEFGLLGAAAIAWAPALLLARWARERRPLGPGGMLLVLLGLSIAVFGLPHDIFYARIFWLALGAAAFSAAAENRV